MRVSKWRVLVVLVTFLALVSSSCSYNEDSVTITAGSGRVYVTFNEIPTFQMWGLRAIEANRLGFQITSKEGTLLLVKRILENIPVQGDGPRARFLRLNIKKIMTGDVPGMHVALNAYHMKGYFSKRHGERGCIRAVLKQSLNVYDVIGWTLLPPTHPDCRLGKTLQEGQPTSLTGN